MTSTAARLHRAQQRLTSLRARRVRPAPVALADFIVRHCQIQIEDGAWVPFTLWPAQQDAVAVLESARLVAWLKARQLGATWISLALALHVLLFQPGVTVLLFSRRDDEARDMLRRLRGMYKRLSPELQLPGTDMGNTKAWALANSARALAFPSRGGDSYTARLVVVDEASLVPELNSLLSSVKPTIDAGGQLILLGRANKADPQGTFATLWRAAEAGQGPWTALFQPWSARPTRTPEWYAEQCADSLARTGGLDVVHEQYPETPDEALAAAVLSKRLPLEWLELCFETLPLVTPDLALPGLTCWELPVAGREYVIGADPAEGIPHRDASAATVLDKGTMAQVAELAGTFEPGVFAGHLANLSAYYHNAGLLIERNNHGHACLLELHNQGARILPGPDGKDGYNTTASTKCRLWDLVAEHLRVGGLRVRSAVARGQLISIEGATLEAPPGEHDDHAVAFGLAVQAAGIQQFGIAQADIDRAFATDFTPLFGDRTV